MRITLLIINFPDLKRKEEFRQVTIYCTYFSESEKQMHKKEKFTKLRAIDFLKILFKTNKIALFIFAKFNKYASNILYASSILQFLLQMRVYVKTLKIIIQYHIFINI